MSQHRTKDMDLKLKKVQGIFHKGLVPLLPLLEHIKQKKDSEGICMALDAFQLLAATSFNLSVAKRHTFRHDMFEHLHPLCDADRSFGDRLFGEDEDLELTAKKTHRLQPTREKVEIWTRP